MEDGAAKKAASRGSSKGLLWAGFFLLLVVLEFIVPYTVLAETAAFSGAFLFWTAMAVVAIIAVGVITAGWRD